MGTVYRIYCPTVEESLVYIRSTKQTLNKRYSEHKSQYKAFKNGTLKKYCASSKLFDAYGVDNCIIEAIEYVDDIDSLVSRERFHFENTPNKLNEKRMAVSEEERAEYNKQFYQSNKQAYLEYKKQYRAANKATILEQAKKRYEANKATILEQAKKRYEAKKASKQSI